MASASSEVDTTVAHNSDSNNNKDNDTKSANAAAPVPEDEHQADKDTKTDADTLSADPSAVEAVMGEDSSTGISDTDTGASTHGANVRVEHGTPGNADNADSVVETEADVEAKAESSIVNDANDNPVANQVVVTSLDGITPAEDTTLPDSSSIITVGIGKTEADATSGQEIASGTALSHLKFKKYDVTSYHYKANTFIQLREGGNPEYVHVNAGLVAAVSPAWGKKMENPFFVFLPCETGGQRQYHEVVKMLSDDDYPIGIKYLLHIIHWKFRELENRPTIDDLYAVACVSEKYGCTFLIAPFAERWLLTGLHWQMTMNGALNVDNGKVLVLAWVFGEARAFGRVFTQVVDEMSLDRDGKNPLDRNGNSWLDQPLPYKLITLMKLARIHRLREIMRALDGPLHDMLEKPKDFKFCRSKDADDIKEACQSQQLGSLMSGLVMAGLMPFPMPEFYFGTVSLMMKKLDEIKCIRYKVPGALPHNDGHMNCGVKHKETIRGIKEQPVKLTRNLAAELRYHGKKTGAYREDLFGQLRVLSPSQDKANPKSFPSLLEDHFLCTQKGTEEFEVEVDLYEEQENDLVGDEQGGLYDDSQEVHQGYDEV